MAGGGAVSGPVRRGARREGGVDNYIRHWVTKQRNPNAGLREGNAEDESVEKDGDGRPNHQPSQVDAAAAHLAK